MQILWESFVVSLFYSGTRAVVISMAMTSRQPLAHKMSVGDRVRVSCTDNDIREGTVLALSDGYVSLHSGLYSVYHCSHNASVTKISCPITTVADSTTLQISSLELMNVFNIKFSISPSNFSIPCNLPIPV